MNELEFRGQVEVRERASDGPLLVMVGLASVAIVTALAYSLLGSSDSDHMTTASIVFASKMVVTSLVITAIVLLALLVRPRPFDASLHADIDGLSLEREGKRRVIRSGSIRGLRVILDGGRSCVEFERGTGVLRLFTEDRDAAERLGGVLMGKERLPAAIARVRQRSSYPLFVSTVCSWILVYGALTALPISLGLGLILVAITTPIAVWVTIRAVPAHILVSSGGLSIRHPLGSREVPALELGDAAVTDDTSVSIALTTGELLEFHGLADHPLDAGVSTANPAAVRLADGLQRVIADNREQLAA